MAEKRVQEMQTVPIPGTGEVKQARTYSGKELIFHREDEKDEQYAKRWEDDRV